MELLHEGHKLRGREELTGDTVYEHGDLSMAEKPTAESTARGRMGAGSF
jgi:hypothetical protein